MRKVLLVTIAALLLAGCGGQREEVALIKTRFGDMVVAFFPDAAPQHVESFKLHAQSGYYDGTTFHRVIPGFVIQGGDPNSSDDDRTNDGTGGAAARFYGIGDPDDSTTWCLPAEFNDRPHQRGALSMARAQDPNSAGSQFFICVADVRRLDHNYTVFGEVVEGLSVADKIVNTPRDINDNPKEPVPMTVRLAQRRIKRQ